MRFDVVFAPEAGEQLIELFEYIAGAASSEVALEYTDAVITFCESLSTYPIRGIPRDDLRPGLRITNYNKRLKIAFAVNLEDEQVWILGFFYGGQDYDTILMDDSPA